MNWKELIDVKKFTPSEEIFKRFGFPKFKLGSRPVYYMGNGFLLGFSSKMFKVDNSNRVEYGEEGEYALRVHYFKNKHDVEAIFKIKNEPFPFDEDILGNRDFEIIEEIETNSTFEHVTACLRAKSNAVYYREGETRALRDGAFVFQNKFVTWDNYTFLFFDTSKKAKMSGFEYTFKE
ncbi:hypothetical protein [Acetonema longum]|nr:hypothetical protein [Acetonema longum]